MFKAIWIPISTPFIAVFTGKYRGYPVTRNPFKWGGMLLWGILLIPFTIFIYPLFIVATYFGFRNISRNGLSAEYCGQEVQVSSQKNGMISKHALTEIKKVTTKFDPPLIFPVIELSSGEIIELKAANYHEFINNSKKHGISVDETPKMQI